MLNFSCDTTQWFTFLTVFVIYACQALQNCGGIQCGADQRCCAQGNGSTITRCCKLPVHTFFDNVGWITRKLSGILILLLLFAMGYFIQRIICPRPRRHHERSEEPSEEPSLFYRHTTASQDSLLDRVPEYRLRNLTSPIVQLPAYEEVKYLPTYEETMQDVDRDRSNENLLVSSDEQIPSGLVRWTDERPGNSNVTRTPRNPA